MIGADAGSAAGDADRREVEVSISIRTILFVAAVAVVAFALASIGDVLLLGLRRSHAVQRLIDQSACACGDGLPLGR